MAISESKVARQLRQQATVADGAADAVEDLSEVVEDKADAVDAAPIADAVASVAVPTKAEFDAVVTSLNSVLAALRSAGIVQP